MIVFSYLALMICISSKVRGVERRGEMLNVAVEHAGYGQPITCGNDIL